MLDINARSSVGNRARGSGQDKPAILQVSGDFPDSFEPAKTPVIRRLIDLTADRFDHHVVSINRTTPPMLSIVKSIAAPGKLRVECEPFDYGEVVRYAAPSRGRRHRTKLVQLGRWLARHIERLPRRPDLIVGHKLSIEGIAVREAARLTGISYGLSIQPYGLSIQGNTDLKIITWRPDLNSLFAKIFH